MSDLTARWVSWEPYFRSVLRIMAAFCFLQFGTAKLFAFPGSMLPDGGTFALASQTGIAGVLEAVGGTLLLLGLATFSRGQWPSSCPARWRSPISWCTPQKGFWTAFNGGTESVVYCFLWLYFFSSRAGPWSLDALRRR